MVVSYNVVKKMGGEKKHILSINEMPSHEHNLTLSAGVDTGLFFTTLKSVSLVSTPTKVRPLAICSHVPPNHLLVSVNLFDWWYTRSNFCVFVKLVCRI